MQRVIVDGTSIAAAGESGHLPDVVNLICDHGMMLEDGRQLSELVVSLLLGHLEQNPTHVSYVKMLGRILEKTGRLGAASACFSRAIALAPLDTDSYERKTAVLERLLAENNSKTRLSGSARKVTTQDGSPTTSGGSSVVVILHAESHVTQFANHTGHGKKAERSADPSILEETLQQLAKHEPSAIIVAAGQGTAELLGPVCSRFDAQLVELQARQEAEQTPAWKYLASCFHWDQGGRTVCLSGKLRFTDASIARILGYRGDAWRAYGISNGMSGAGQTKPVCYGIAFKESVSHERNLILLDRLYRARICLAADGGWALSHLMRNDDPNRNTPGDNFEEIDSPSN